MSLALAVLVLIPAAQDVSLPDLLRGLEESERAARGTEFEVVRTDGWKAARVQVAVDGAIRIESPWRGGLVQVLGRDDLTLHHPAEGALSGGWPMRGARERITLGLLPASDLQQILPQGYLGWALAPARRMAADPSLRILGRSTLNGEACLILSARARVSRTLSLPNCMGLATAEASASHFYVSLREPRLLRMTVRTLWTPCWMNTLEDIRFQDWDRGVPRRIRWTHGRDAEESVQEATYVVNAFREGLRTTGSAWSPPPGDLEARWARDPGLTQRLEHHPEDPEVLYSAALRALLDGAKSQDDPETPVIRAIQHLERALAKRRAEAPLHALFSLYQGSEVKQVALAERIAMMTESSPALRADAARAFVEAGAPDRALEILPPTGFEGVRMNAFAALKDFDRALETAATHPETCRQESYYLFHGTEHGPEGGAFREALDRARRKHPASPVLNEISVNGRTIDGSLSELCARIEQAPGTGASAVQALRYRLIRRESENDHRASKADVVRERDRLLRVLETEGKNDATAWILRGSVHRTSGDAASAAQAYEGAWTRFGPLAEFRAQADLLGLELEAAGDPRWIERGWTAIVAHGRKMDAGPWDLGSVPAILIRRRLAADEGGRLLDDFRGLKAHGVQYGLLGVRGLTIPEQQKLTRSVLAEARHRKDEVETLRWLATVMESDEEEQGTWGADPAEFYGRILDRLPQDVGALERVAVLLRRKGDTPGTVNALRRLRKAHDAGAAPVDPRWTTRRVNLILAEQLLKQGDREDAAGALDRADLSAEDVRPWELWCGAEALRALGDVDSALLLLRRLEDAGYRPYISLAELHETKKDRIEGLRALNRALAFGCEPRVPSPFDRPVGGFNGRIQLTPPEAKSIQELRRDLRTRAGEAGFIRRFLEAPAPRLSEAEERTVAGAISRLGSAVPDEREEAESALRRIGPGAAPALAAFLEASDAELRTRVRSILFDWAEPR